MARRDTMSAEMFEEPGLQATGTEGARAKPLQQAAAERLAAHRSRRQAQQAEREAILEAVPAAIPEAGQQQEPDAAARRVREAVAARYRESLSYREYLAAESERALEKAKAEAEVAARNVKAVEAAQIELMEELDKWATPAPVLLSARVVAGPGVGAPVDGAVSEATPGQVRASLEPLRVRMFEELATATTETKMPAASMAIGGEVSEVEIAELDEEIEFRLAPEFEVHHMEALPIQANIIEFPRQIVAPRKARPRLAEGPLRGVDGRARAEAEAQPQLRIFEVEPDLICQQPSAEADVPMAGPEWQDRPLDAGFEAPPVAVTAATVLQGPILKSVATLELRLMAAAVDAAWIGAAFVVFASVAALCAGHALGAAPRWMLGAAAGVALLLIAALYPLLFFTFGEATPGMLYAEIGLCTFTDENPTRAAMRRRLLATLVAVTPLGLGVLWSAVDGQRMGWNDRWSGMYLRAY